MARNYAALPYDYLEEMAALNDAEFGRLTRALLVYSMTGEPIALCGNERFYAKRVMAQEDRFRASYEEQVAAKSERGKAGAKARWSNAKNAQAFLSITSNAKNGNTETKTETDTETNALPPTGGKGKGTRFAPPSIQEVTDYCRERGNGVDPERFVDFYAAKGWKVGNQPMKDWKAAVRTWEKRNEEKKRAQPSRGIKLSEAEKPVDHSSEFARMDRYLAKMREGS